MKKTPLTVVVVALLAALAGAGITFAIIHIRFPAMKGLNDSFYALVIKEAHSVKNVKDFTAVLDSLKTNTPDDENVSYCFQLEGQPTPLEYGPQETPCASLTQPKMPALTHKIYAVSAWDVAKVAFEVDGKIAPTPTPTP
jgi:hypothetical protein